MGDLINRITGNQQQTLNQLSFPNPPQSVYQEKPTHIEASGIKYNAFNVEKVSFDIVSKQGFNNNTPDLIVWDQYKYDVKELIANADEKELTQFLTWAIKSNDLKDFKIDFSSGGNAVISGKYKGLLPFSVEMNVSKTSDSKLLFSFDKVKTLFQLPNTIRDLLITSLLDLKETPGLLSALQLKQAFVRFSDNKVIFDPSKINPSLNMPIKFFETSDSGFVLKAGISDPVSTPVVNNPSPVNPPVNNNNPSALPVKPPTAPVNNIPVSQVTVDPKYKDLLKL